MQTEICKGFKAGGIAAGLKKNGGRDLGLIVSDSTATVAGVFTTNRVKAAPVILCMERVRSGMCRAIIVNSGNANCCTGEKGMADAVEMAGKTACLTSIPEEHVLVASTGVIGEPLPMNKVENALPELVRSISYNGFDDFTKAIMTTDTVPKLVSAGGEIDGKPFIITGMAKGAGMIRPDLATMLCFVLTDARVDSDMLRAALKRSVDISFNRITIDGDTSTNDTVLLLSNGASGVEISNASHQTVFQAVLDKVLLDLAKKVVRDGEGATKLVEVIVLGAKTEEDAKTVAFTIANSPLVKTAFFGEDANWGRIFMAAGRSGIPIEPSKIDLFFDGVKLVENGLALGKDAEADATKVLGKSEFSVTLDLHMGGGSAAVFTTDFSLDYVKINADYRS